MNKILIIGSKGFIGSACYSYLKLLPENVIYGADVVVDYTDANYFVVDPSNADFREIFRHEKFDWCINCAGAASVPDSFKNPLRDYLLNVNLLVQLLNAIKEENIDCRLIQLSSAAVYGNPQVLPIKEDHVLSPLSPYGIHKKQAEEVCKLYYDYYGISSFVLRIFSAYGSGLKKQLFWDLYTKSQSNDNLTLFGTGKETREFIHVNDVANALNTIIRTGQPGYRVINIANNASITIEKAAKIFLQNIGFNGNTNFNGINRVGDPLYWKADTSLINNLGYQPKISFEDGITDYCKWVKGKE